MFVVGAAGQHQIMIEIDVRPRVAEIGKPGNGKLYISKLKSFFVKLHFIKIKEAL